MAESDSDIYQPTGKFVREVTGPDGTKFEVNPTSVELIRYLPNVEKLETGKVVKNDDVHDTIVNPASSQPRVIKKLAPNGKPVVFAYVHKGKEKDKSVDDGDLYPWKEGDKQFDPKEAVGVYYIPDTVPRNSQNLGTRIDYLDVRTARGGLFDVNGEEVDDAYVHVDSVKIGGTVYSDNVHKPAGKGWVFKEDSQPSAALAAPTESLAGVSPDGGESEPALPQEHEPPVLDHVLSPDEFQGELLKRYEVSPDALAALEGLEDQGRDVMGEAWRAMTGIKNALNADSQNQKYILDTIDGHPGYSDILADYAYQSIRDGKFPPEGGYQHFMQMRRMGKQPPLPKPVPEPVSEADVQTSQNLPPALAEHFADVCGPQSGVPDLQDAFGKACEGKQGAAKIPSLEGEMTPLTKEHRRSPHPDDEILRSLDPALLAEDAAFDPVFVEGTKTIVTIKIGEGAAYSLWKNDQGHYKLRSPEDLIGLTAQLGPAGLNDVVGDFIEQTMDVQNNIEGSKATHTFKEGTTKGQAANDVIRGLETQWPESSAEPPDLSPSERQDRIEQQTSTDMPADISKTSVMKI